MGGKSKEEGYILARLLNAINVEMNDRCRKIQLGISRNFQLF